MHSTHSIYKCLLVGLIVLYLTFTAEALPARTSQKTTKFLSRKSSALVKNTHRLGHVPVSLGLGKHSSSNSCAPRSAGSHRLHKRNEIPHPSGKDAITLFHGTQSQQFANDVRHEIDLAKTSTMGDLHYRKKDGKCDGGMYLTDSVIAAAQFACYNKRSEVAYVLEFDWNPIPNGFQVFEFPPNAKLTRNQCQEYDMITGHMHKAKTDDNLSISFWQYAIVNQRATTGLTYKATHVIPCRKPTGQPNVPIGQDLSNEAYKEGQRTDPGFSNLLNSLTNGQFCSA